MSVKKEVSKAGGAKRWRGAEKKKGKIHIPPRQYNVYSYFKDMMDCRTTAIR